MAEVGLLRGGLVLYQGVLLRGAYKVESKVHKKFTDLRLDRSGEMVYNYWVTESRTIRSHLKRPSAVKRFPFKILHPGLCARDLCIYADGYGVLLCVRFYFAVEV